MSIFYRRLLYLSFFLIFFVLAPVFIAYSLGYRYRIDTNAVEKNGAFYIKSFPRGAEIYIDKKFTKHKTPDQITEIRPGKYSVDVKKSGYLTWQKDLTVYPGETTFAQDIVLFLADIKKQSLGEGADSAVLNVTKDKYAYINKQKKQLFVTDVEQEKNYWLYDVPSANFQILSWSPDSQKLLVNDSNKYYLFDINTKKLQLLPIPQSKHIAFDVLSSNLLWYIVDAKLYNYDSQEQSVAKNIDLKQDLIDFALSEDYLIILYADKINKDNILEQLDINDFHSINKVKGLSLGDLKAIALSPNQLVFSIGSTFYLKNENEDLISLPINLQDKHDERILLSNGHEVILYDYKNNWQNLIDRSTQIVTDLIWHPNGSYFLSEVNGQTYLTEIDGRDHRNSVLLLENPVKKNYFFNKKGDKLYVLTPSENFTLTIQ